MNYISYFKKQGFRKCPQFFITECGYGNYDVLKENGSEYKTNLVHIYEDRDGDYKMTDRGVDIFVNHKKGLRKVNISIGNLSGVRENDNWNQLVYKDDENYIYVYILRGYYNIILTDEKFSYIISEKHKPLTELESGVFNNRLEKMMGKYQYRNYLINKL